MAEWILLLSQQLLKLSNVCTSVNGGGWGMHPPTFWQGGCNASHPPLLRRTCVNHHNVTFN